MKTMTITVPPGTKNGGYDCETCPVAEAITRRLAPKFRCRVLGPSIAVYRAGSDDSKVTVSPKEVAEFLAVHDGVLGHGDHYPGFSFPLALPDHMWGGGGGVNVEERKSLVAALFTTPLVICRVYGPVREDTLVSATAMDIEAALSAMGITADWLVASLAKTLIMANLDLGSLVSEGGLVRAAEEQDKDILRILEIAESQPGMAEKAAYLIKRAEGARKRNSN